MNVFIKGVNSCTQRRINIGKYKQFIQQCGHKIVQNIDSCEVVLLWTCGFRGDFKQHSVNMIQALQKQKRVIACGCLPSIDEDAIRQLHIDYFSWKNENEILKYFGTGSKWFNDGETTVVEGPIPIALEEFCRQYPKKKVSFCDQFIKVYISEGCKYKCSYCSEKFAFPVFRSFDKELILKQCEKMVEKTNNYNIVLFGDSLGHYGEDLGYNLFLLIREILRIHPRIKVGLDNLNPADFLAYCDQYEELLANQSMFYLSLPIQSASQRMLELMKREYNVKDIEKIFKMLQKYNFKELVTHLLVGFPTETEDDFRQSINFILRYRPKYVLLSKYMETNIMDSYELVPKITNDITQARINEAVEKFNHDGIICNYDGCDYMQEKFQKEQIELGEFDQY